MYEVVLTRRAYHEFNKLSLTEQERIEAALVRLSTNPRLPSIRKIQGNIYRIRAGNRCIIYAVFNKDRLVLVGRIVRRSEDSYDRVKERF